MNIIACVWKVCKQGNEKKPRIHRVEQPDSSYKFVVRLNEFCLNKDGQWESEPMPSSRANDFIKRTRFDDFESATMAVERVL